MYMKINSNFTLKVQILLFTLMKIYSFKSSMKEQSAEELDFLLQNNMNSFIKIGVIPHYCKIYFKSHSSKRTFMNITNQFEKLGRETLPVSI